jgi:hypothetical protein
LLAAIKAIVTSPTGAVSDILCLNLSSTLSEHTTKKEVAKILAKLINQYWFQTVSHYIVVTNTSFVKM